MFLKWGHSEGSAGMQFTLRCRSADGRIRIYRRQGSFECSEGGLFESFLLALEFKLFGSSSLYSGSLGCRPKMGASFFKDGKSDRSDVIENSLV